MYENSQIESNCHVLCIVAALFVCMFFFQFLFSLGEEKKNRYLYLFVCSPLFRLHISNSIQFGCSNDKAGKFKRFTDKYARSATRKGERERKRESQRRLAFLIKLSAALNNDKINSPALLCYSRENVFGVIICISKPIWFFHEHWLTDFRADNFFICRLLKVYSSDTLSDWHYILQDRLLIIA